MCTGRYRAKLAPRGGKSDPSAGAALLSLQLWVCPENLPTQKTHVHRKMRPGALPGRVRALVLKKADARGPPNLLPPRLPERPAEGREQRETGNETKRNETQIDDIVIRIRRRHHVRAGRPDGFVGRYTPKTHRSRNKAIPHLRVHKVQHYCSFYAVRRNTPASESSISADDGDYHTAFTQSRIKRQQRKRKLPRLPWKRRRQPLQLRPSLSVHPELHALANILHVSAAAVIR